MRLPIRAKLAAVLIIMSSLPMAMVLIVMFVGGSKLITKGIAERMSTMAAAPAGDMEVDIEEDIGYMVFNMQRQDVIDFLSNSVAHRSIEELDRLDREWPTLSETDKPMASVLNNPLSAELRRMMKFHPFPKEIFVTDRYGQLVAATGRTSDFYQKGETWWDEAYADGKGGIYISEIGWDASSQVWSLDVSFPIMKDGEVLGVIKSVRNVDDWVAAIQEELEREEAENIKPMLVRRDGRITYPLPDANAMIVESPPDPVTLMEPLAQWEGRITEHPRIGWRITDAGRLEGYAKVSFKKELAGMEVKSPSWVLILSTPKSEALGQLNKLSLKVLAAGVAIIAMIFLLGLWLADRNVVRRISRLAVATRKMAAGDYSSRISATRGILKILPSDELDELSEDFNSMISQVEGSYEAIKTSESNYREVFDAGSDAMFVHDVDTGAILDVNQRACEIFGYSHDELCGKSVGELSSGESPYTHDDAMRQMRKVTQGYPQSFEWLCKDHKERLFWVEFNLKLAMIGNEGRLLASLRDITDRKLAEEALRDSQERLKTVADFTYDWEYWTGSDGRYIYVSPSCERITGYRMEEFFKNPSLLREITHPDDLEAIEHHLDEHNREGQGSAEIDFRIIRPDGEVRWIAHVCQGVYGADGKWLGRRASNRDATDRRHADEILRDSEERYRMLVETMAEGLALGDENYNFTYVNGPFCRMLGYTQDEMLGKPMLDFVHPEFKHVMEARQAERRSGEEGSYEFAWLAKDGYTLWTIISPKGIFDSDGTFCGSLGVVTDITDRKRTERELQDSEEKYRLLFATESNAILMAEADTHTIIDANEAACSMYGYTRDEFVGMRPEDISVEPDVTDENLRKALEGATMERSTREHRRKDGTTFHVEISNTVFTMHAKRVICAIIRDITENIESERALRASEEQNRTIIENMLTGFALNEMIYDEQGQAVDWRFITTNPAFSKLVGIPDPSGSTVRDIMPDLHQSWIDEFGQVGKTGLPRRFQKYQEEVAKWWDVMVYKIGENQLAVMFQDITAEKKAVEEIAKLAKFPDENPNPVLRVSADGQLLYGNKASDRVRAMWGCEPGQEVHGEWRDLIQQAMESGENLRAELECADGTTFLLWLAPVVVGGYVNLYGLDMTAEKKAVEEIAKLAKFPDENPNPVMRVSSDGQLLYGNNASDCVRATWQCETGQEVRGEWRELIQRALDTGENIRTELECTDGKTFLLSLAPIVDGGYVNIYGLDVTTEKEASEELQASQQMLQSILNTIPVRVFWKDTDSIYIGGNWHFCHDAGLDAVDELIGKTDYKLGWVEQADRYRADDRLVMDSGKEKLGYEEPQTTPSGEKIWLRTSKVPLKDAKGKIIGVLGTYEDITEQKRVYEALHIANELKTNFIRVAGHELRTPVSYILGAVRLLKDSRDPDKLLHAIQVMGAKAKRLDEIIQGMFKLIRQERYGAEMCYEDVIVGELVEEVQLDVFSFVNRRNQKFLIEGAKDVPVIRGDRAKLRDVIENLVMNAIKFTPDGGEIRLDASESDGYLTIAVSDQGPGIPPAELKHIFEPFYSGGDVLKHSSGMIGYEKRGIGLGLAIVQYFVELHGGGVDVETGSEGSTFMVRIPMRR